MKYRKMQKLLAANGWVEEYIGIWTHPDIANYFIDGNGGNQLVIKRLGGWTDIDNCYGFIDNELDLLTWMETHDHKIRDKS